MKNALLSFFLLGAICAPGSAEILWSWQFATEEGTFRTNGTFADLAGPGEFNVLEFQVGASSVGSTVGATYTPLIGGERLLWDGTTVTGIVSGDGPTFAQFNEPVSGHHYSFYFDFRDMRLEAELRDPDDQELIDDVLLTVLPESELLSALEVPVGGQAATFMLIALLAGTAAIFLRRIH